MRLSILASRDIRRKEVPAPEWSMPSGLYVKALTIIEALAFEKAKVGLEEQKIVGLYLAYSLCDEDGDAIFDPACDVEEILTKEPSVLTRIFEEAVALNNGATDEDAAEKS